ncbi:PDZ domain-containing protein 8 isoform X2 [Monodelphis domestica]|uniref:PDZ domain containing 8 n=1 Tax=Monodelphis domestica TaxID=13616 RepID=F7CPE7_MONDO|nr:PDZ domain-containing protein 8 isoform X2 [Monodelphis domestica]
MSTRWSQRGRRRREGGGSGPEQVLRRLRRLAGMELLLIIAVSALAGSFLTIFFQFLLFYCSRPKKPVAASSADLIYTSPVPGLHLRDYLYGGFGKKRKSSGSGVGHRTSKMSRAVETCYFLNAIILFLFRELRDTTETRRWVTKKIKVEFQDLLQSKTAGRVLEGLSLREVYLGQAVPFVRTVRLLRPVVPSYTGEPEASTKSHEELPTACPEELIFELDIEYNGGFHMAIDVDLVFGRSAYLFVKLARMKGKIQLIFTRTPFTHWAFSFVEEPVMDLEVQSQFEGHPMPQLANIIINQLKKVIKRRHTIPNYKIRFKPFFPYEMTEESEEILYIQQYGLKEGRLKISLLECSRLMIFGSYEREANIHCTLELSSSIWEEKQRTSVKVVEVVKGNLPSVGLTLRLVQSSDGCSGHVVIETVAPHSPAALADLQRGDRIVAIGGIKITSTVQVLKLIKQAGEKVMVCYERPVGQNNIGSSSHESFTQEEFLTTPPNDDDIMPGLLMEAERREADLEFEDLASYLKSQNYSKDEDQTISSSPKHCLVSVAKPSGPASPVLNLKSGGISRSVKSMTPKISDSSDIGQASAKATQVSLFKPSQSPKQQRKFFPPSIDDSSNQAESDSEKPDKILYSTQAFDQTEDSILESTHKDSADDQTWESSEIPYSHKLGKWTRMKGTCIFDIEAYHKYLNVALWCRDPFKLGDLICLGHVSIKLEEIALGCLATSNLEYLTKFQLNAPTPKAMASRSTLRNLSMKTGFNENFCYGDITIQFKYLKEGEHEQLLDLLKKERETHLSEEEDAFNRDEYFDGQLGSAENKHAFQDTQFQNPTWCDYCKKKVWTKAASQCVYCAYVCHKKCQEKCFSENPICIGAGKKSNRLFKNLRLEGQENIIGLQSRADSEASKSAGKSAGLTKHLLNTSSRFLNLRQGSRRTPDQINELAEPSPKHTPTTSDNEMSDHEVCGLSSPCKKGTDRRIKLARKERGLDDSVFIAVKEIGRDLYRGLPIEERFQKLEFMLDKLQNEIDQELEHNNSLAREEKETTDSKKKAHLLSSLAKSGERLQALTLLMIHYKAGIEDLELETLYNTKKAAKYTEETEEDLHNEIRQLIVTQPFDSLSDELFEPSEPL